jgi:N-acetylglucosamine-6-phosphate deacetylase
VTTLRGRVVLPVDSLADAVVVVAGDRVVEVRLPRPGDPEPRGTLLPGLVDGHCHGGGGHPLAHTDPDEVRAAAAFHLARGTTTLVASLVTDDATAMLAQVSVLAGLVDEGVVAGVHLEGPFLSPDRRGAHPAHLLREPGPDLAERLLRAGRGHVRHVTLAPERPGAAAVADLVRAAGAVVAVGHSDADAATARAAFDAGARSATHLFNAMRPWQHRDSSVVSAALAAAGRGQVVVELIGDGTHVDAGTVAAVFDLVAGQVALVSDAAPPAGLPDGDHVLGAAALRVRGGVARTDDGAIAGGSGSLLDVVRFTHRQAGVDLAVAVAAASRVPAALLGLDRESDGRPGVGRIAPGARADLLLVDDDLRPLQVWRAGQPVG